MFTSALKNGVALKGPADRMLASLGHEVEWHEYPMAHEVCADEIDRIGRWLRDVLPRA